MGFWAIFSAECLVDQGLSAVSVLSMIAPIAITSIFVGKKLALEALITGRFLFKSFW